MANTITKIQSYLTNLLDEIYKKNSISSVLDNENTRAIEGVTSQVLIPKMSFSGGLADYNKDSGATKRTMTLGFETFTLTKDRGATLTLDAVENIDSAGILLAQMESEFIRTKVAPETDAYRFGVYHGKAATKVTGTLTASTTEDALLTAIAALEDKEVPVENLILFMNPQIYKILKEEVQTRRLVEGTTVQNNVAVYDGIPVYRVPTSRFNTTVTLGTDGFTASGQNINFLLMDKRAPMQVIRHRSNKLFAPDVNQSTDGWLWRFRYFHDATVPENKCDGVYSHAVAAGGD